ncbi:PIN domain-containing protein [Tautonia marina]|uniref:PIN domain-containing protein n=1 Tax=Tautonia marina TaxID=2653855 RepID=UPI001260BBA5|nr:PIN domain-containing protein [Tautonia marina]
MRRNYVLIDYENVQPESLKGLDAEHFRVLLFVGATQTKVSYEIAEGMQRLGSRAQYVKMAGKGSNALDFHIAFYIGYLAANDPTAFFHIISKDTGFDPLVQHLKTNKVFIVRSKAIESITLVKVANSKTLPDRVAVLVADLKKRGTARPKSVKTLTSTVASVFQKQLKEPELAELIAELQRRGFISLHEAKVSYALPEGDP